MDQRLIGSEIKMALDGREPLEVLNILVRRMRPEREQLGPDWILEANAYPTEGMVGVKCVRRGELTKIETH